MAPSPSLSGAPRATTPAPGRLAVSGTGLVGWGGGLEFARFCLEGLRAELGSDDAVLFAAPRPGQADEPGLRLLARRVRLALSASRRSDAAAAASVPAFTEAQITSSVRPPGSSVAVHFHQPGFRSLARLLREERVAAVVPSARLLPPLFPIPWVGYLSDCQHRHLPRYFGEAERALRDRFFAAMLRRARVVVVNSRAARADFASFYPGHRAQLLALPFSAHAADEWLAADPAEARSRHGVGARYFIVCNQFWIHKDHPTAFRALAMAAARGLAPDVELVCTGKLEDGRDPGYPERIRRLLGELGLAGRTRLLGFIPKTDQALLVRGALAVVQPTLFEGGPGGGAAYDAISLGVPLIASDIPVNRELPEGRVAFFPAGDPEALAARLLEAARSAPAPVAPEVLRREGAERLRAFGQALVAAAGAARGS